MMPVIKLSVLAISIVVGLTTVINYFSTDWVIQIGALCAALFLNVITFNMAATLAFLVPVLTVAALYGIISLLFVWVGYEIVALWQPVYFLFSMLWVRGVLGWISFKDLLGLPLSHEWQKDLLTFRALLGNGQPTLGRFIWYADRMTGPDTSKRLILQSRLSAMLAFVLWFWGQGPWVSIIVENRIRVLKGRAHET
jgi:hypothetical protein